VRAEKNKLSSPGEHFLYDYYFKQGPNFSVGEIDHIGEVVRLGVLFGLIEQKGAFYYVQGQNFQGQSNLRKGLAMDMNLVADLYKEIVKRY
jgi:hypothetical protein